MSQFCQPTGLREKGITAGLQYIDCNSEQIIQYAFNRFFGPGGVLGWALTIILTIYVALIAYRLLSGRGRLSALPPRMLLLGLILTFATSWIGYQSFVLNIALGAPEELAKILLNTKGSATYAFSRQLDIMFQAIAQVALQSRPAGEAAATGIMSAEGDLLWTGALMLLLATVGVLIVARMALAMMLALGPIFIILALFSGTRGLFVGWLKTVIMLAVTPLFAVLLGGGTLALIRPLVMELAKLNGEIDMRIAVNIFLAASVHVALMLMAIKLSTTLVSGWQLPWAEGDQNGEASSSGASASEVAAISAAAMAPVNAQAAAQADAGSDPRTQSILRAVDQAAAASASVDSAERADFTRNFVMTATEMRDGGDASGQRGNRVVQALGRKYRPATIDAVRLRREGVT
jgi:type IV secretion system protein VirB6